MKVLLFHTWSLFVYLALGVSLLVVRLSLRCDFPQGFGIACVLASYSCANTLVLPHGSGAISEACVYVLGIT